ESVRTQAGENPRFGGYGYTMLYRSNTGSCFAIEAVSGGIGDIPQGNRSYPVNNPVLGRGSLEEYAAGQNGKAPALVSTWFGKFEQGGFVYHLIGAGVRNQTEGCQNIPPREAVKVLESLRYLPK
ncbi:hypothetical protein H6F43_16215, partial [Leptolyngbya sp. FACHB-36]|uniref:hypothetical protein n=1 Tax=Leptolyngbya sp. FACHB-36 TaxID=2692808 RepID=UPI00168143A7